MSGIFTKYLAKRMGSYWGNGGRGTPPFLKANFLSKKNSASSFAQKADQWNTHREMGVRNSKGLFI